MDQYPSVAEDEIAVWLEAHGEYLNRYDARRLMITVTRLSSAMAQMTVERDAARDQATYLDGELTAVRNAKAGLAASFDAAIANAKREGAAEELEQWALMKDMHEGSGLGPPTIYGFRERAAALRAGVDVAGEKEKS